MIAEVGKRYMVVRESRDTVERFPAVIRWVEDRGDFWYIGYEPDDNRVCLWGMLKIKKNGKYKAVNYTLEGVL